jgi:hypothetical protein
VTEVSLPRETQVAVRYPPAPPPPDPSEPAPPPPPPTTKISGTVEVQFFFVKVPEDVIDVTLVEEVHITFTGPTSPPLAIAD